MMPTRISQRLDSDTLNREVLSSTGLPVHILPLSTIKPHERIDLLHAIRLDDEIVVNGYFTTPILVDHRDQILLDGHHRYWVLSKRIRARFIPAVLVDYDNESLINVTSWRDGIVVNRSVVREAAFSGRLLKCKTSRHLLSFEIGQIRIPLSDLEANLPCVNGESYRSA